MRFLLDTHILVWWHTDEPKLGVTHRRLLDAVDAGTERVAISDVSLWEIAKLVEVGKLHFIAPVDQCLAEIEGNPAIEILPITSRIAVESTRLGRKFPRDPADQLIVATARIHGLSLLTADRPIRTSGAVPVS